MFLGRFYVNIFNKVILLLLSVLSYYDCQAQQIPDRFIFSTAGRDLKNLTLGTPASQNRRVTFTMGEPIIGQFSLAGKRLNVGFIQPDGIFPIAPPSPVQITLNDPFQISPNPATNFTIIKAPELWEGKVTIQLMDSQGKLVKTQTMESLVLEFSLDHQISPGNYFLNFYKEDGSFLQQSKLIKMYKQ
jgi:hypothetical protein